MLLQNICIFNIHVLNVCTIKRNVPAYAKSHLSKITIHVLMSNADALIYFISYHMPAKDDQSL